MPISISQVVNVALALAVVYYVLGLTVSTIARLLLEIFQTRGKIFEGFLKKQLLGVAQQGQENLLDRLKQMPQINSLRPVRYKGLGFLTGKTKLSDYVERIPPKNLVDALFDLQGTVKEGNDKIREVIDLLPNEYTTLDGQTRNFEAKKKLGALVESGYDNVEEMREKLETWFSGVMDQAAQDFKAKARLFIVYGSFLVVFFFGVDTLSIAQRTWTDASLAKEIDAQASLILQSSDDENKKNADLKELYGTLDEMQVVNFKWYVKSPDADANWLFWKIVGMIITALAVSQGSSFWYDIIRQIKGEQKSTRPAKLPEHEGKPPEDGELSTVQFARVIKLLARENTPASGEPGKNLDKQ